jgi:hypothetical protein
MAALHNKNRYGEQYDPEEIAAILAEIEAVREYVAVSGGWAWHFMSPPHSELKHAHDHKDADLFVDPDRLWEMLPLIKSRRKALQRGLLLAPDRPAAVRARRKPDGAS